MGVVDLDTLKLGQGEDFPPSDEFMKLKTQQGQINWLAQAVDAVNEAAGKSTYELPIADDITLGGVKITQTEDNALTCDADGQLKAGPATSYTLGAVMVPTAGGLYVDAIGQLEVITNPANGTTLASSSGDRGASVAIAIDGNSLTTTENGLALNAANNATLGGVKTSDTSSLNVTEDGTLGTAKIDTATGLALNDDGTIANTTTYSMIGTKHAYKRCGTVTIANGYCGIATNRFKDTETGETFDAVITLSDPILDGYSSSGEITQVRRAKLVPTDATSGQMTIAGMPCTSGFGPLPSVVVLTVTDAIGLNTGDGLVYVESNMYSGDKYTKWVGYAMDAILLNTTTGGVTTFTMGFKTDTTATSTPVTGYLASSDSVTIEAGTYLLFLS